MAVSARDLCAETGITYRQLDYWTTRGVLQPLDRRSLSSGVPRPFDESEVRVARALASLRSLGAGLDVLIEVASQLRSGSMEWSGTIFVNAGGVVHREPCGLCCWALDLDPIAA